MKKFILVSALMLNVVIVWGQINLSTIGSPYTQDFNTLSNSATSSTLPSGWFLSESGTGSNATYTAGTGSIATGDTYSFGATSSTDRSLGTLQSGTVIPTIGAQFSNTSGSTITSLIITYTGEQWRLGTAGRVDRLDFQYSTSATSLTTGTWTDENSLDFTAPITTGTLGAFDGNLAANRLTITFTISGLSIASGSSIWIRWNDFNASGADDGLGIDDFSITPQATSPSTSITTTSLSSSSFTVNCSTTATGTVDFTSTGSFTAGNVYTAQLSNSAGSFTSPISIGTLNSTSNSGTINISIPAGTATGVSYRIRVVSSTPSTTGTDNGSNITITLNPCTITTGLVSGGPFTVDCSTGDAGSVAFTSSGTFAVGNTFTVQLSNASGSFASPTTIGTLTGASAQGLNPSGSINFNIPSATTTGSGYLIRIISSNPSVTGSNSAANSVTLSGGPCTLTPIYVTSMLFDGCDVSCGSGVEGKSEIIFGTTGGYSLTPNATNVVLNYTTGGYIMSSTVVANTTTTANLNTAAACPGLFVDGFGTTIPPNSSFLLVSNNLCVSALTWSNLCGTGPIYVIYAGAGSSGANWHDGGNFGNSGGSKNFTMTFTASDGTVLSDTYSYTAPGSATDGNYAKWNEFGGTPVEQGNMPNCDITPVVLPSELVSFYGINYHEINSIYWQTASEQNNDYYTLSHSTDGYNFFQIAQLDGAGNSDQLLSYSFDHVRPSAGINYYKLSSTDFDGTNYSKGIIAINTKSNLSFYNSITSSIELSSKSSVALYSLEGKLILMAEKTTQIPFNETGVYLLVNQLTGETERIFIPE
ncbi:MAG: hypothetical protein RI922_772 [Bacteroidota bacterium]|jgi:hypothetical protein